MLFLANVLWLRSFFELENTPYLKIPEAAVELLKRHGKLHIQLSDEATENRRVPTNSVAGSEKCGGV